MIKILKKRLSQEEEGFTLIELMVVLLIIAILMLIAIPTFLGARTKAQNRGAQSDLRNALTAEKTAYTSGSAYHASPTTLKAIEPSLNWVNTTPVKGVANQVEAMVGPNKNTTCLVALSAGGNYYGIADIATGTGTGAGTADSPGTYFIDFGTTAPTFTCSNAISGTAVTSATPATNVWSTGGF